MFDATRRFLSAQFESTIPLYVQLFTLVLHFFWCWLFVDKLDGKVVGVAMATNITYILNFIIQEAVCYHKDSLR